MDTLDELNGKIEELCSIAERKRERVLDELFTLAHLSIEYGPEDRRGVAQLALDYAEWTRALEGYRSLLRGSAPIARVK